MAVKKEKHLRRSEFRLELQSELQSKIQSKKGSQMVEAAIVLPIIILGIFLMLRLFVFCLEILNTGIKEHEKLLEKWDSKDTEIIDVYDNNVEIDLLRGGLLGVDVHKDIHTKAYCFNEDAIIRAEKMLKN